MKKFKVQVQNGKAEFFKELLRNLDFVDFEEVDDFHEPRVYPGANFEIRSPKHDAQAGVGNRSERLSEREKSIDDIRKVLSKIDAIRDKNKK